VVFVGPGSPAHAETFARTLPAAVTALCDPGLGAFKAAGMRRGVGSTVRLRLLVNLWRALRAGFRQQRVLGDAWQQGGVVVFGRDGALRHRQVDRVSGDVLDLDAVLAAVRAG
jgi:hypothetical protein